MKFKSSFDSQIDIKKDYSKKVIFYSKDFLEPGHVFQEATIFPNTKQRMHFHFKQTEVFYIISGESILNINNKEYPVKPGDAFICEPKDKHFFWNKTNQELKLVVFKINKDENSEDTEWVEK
jgi:quercetin dioxygenase-like cupin family protein